MLDGHGRVRITDFGLAAMADRLRPEDARSGTPAYSSPEQLAGKAASAKSDIYALGLVLYEIFTGSRAFGAGTTRDLLPRSPSSLVTDVDSGVDRIILQCLDPDPADRPHSAMAVAAALPGGDPLAAALAAGETPSPEMVALAGSKDQMRLGTAVACLAVVMAGLVVAALVGSKVDLVERAHLGKPPEVLAQNAAEWIARLGYQETPRDRAYGFDYAYDVLRFFEEKRIAWPPFTQAGVVRPSPIVFWYRQSPQNLNAGFISFAPGTVTRDDPPPTTPGMVMVVLDPLGRLLSFSAVPQQQEDRDEAATSKPDFGLLFAAAGIDSDRFTAAGPKRTPRSAFDARFAWTGSYVESPEIPLRMEAAYWRSKLVSLETTGPWSGVPAGRRQEPGGGAKIVQVTETFIFLAMLAGGALLARRNTRLGRGDRRGAARVALFLFFAEMLVWALGANHVPEFWEMALLYMALAKAAYIAGLTWMLYLALEPYVRRQWPRTLISWNRVISGRIGDSLAGAHVLIGAVVGTLVTLLKDITMLANCLALLRQHRVQLSFAAGASGWKACCFPIAVFRRLCCSQFHGVSLCRACDSADASQFHRSGGSIHPGVYDDHRWERGRQPCVECDQRGAGSRAPDSHADALWPACPGLSRFCAFGADRVSGHDGPVVLVPCQHIVAGGAGGFSAPAGIGFRNAVSGGQTWFSERSGANTQRRAVVASTD